MMNRSGTGKQMKGGMNPKKARREQPSGSTPAQNVQGSGSSKGGTQAHKNTIGNGEHACKAGGHLMGKPC